MTHPVAVTLPTFNQRPDVLKAAVTSCIDAGCHYVGLYDDGSVEPVGDALGDLCDHDAVEFYRGDENMGVPTAFNRALQTCLDYECEWIARFSSDDLMRPNKLAAQIEWANETGANAIFHDAATADGIPYPSGMPGPRDWPGTNRARWRKRLLASNRIVGTTTLIRAEYMRRYLDEGGHPPELTYCHDWYLNCWVEFEVPGGWSYMPQVLSTIGRYSDGMEAKSHADPHGQWCKDRCAEMVRKRWG